MTYKVWIIYKREDYGHDKIHDDKVYSTFEKAETAIEELFKNESRDDFYIDYLEVD